MKPIISDSFIENILLSIVIPTKNRQKYCAEALKHLISLNLRNVEIVVQDNSDKPILEEQLKERCFLKHVRYHYNPAVLSFVDNFSEAISLCHGEYICMIGDDDSVLPNIIGITEYARDNDVDAIIPQLQVYHWPSEQPLNPRGRNGFLATLPYRNSQYKALDIRKTLIHLIENFFQDYQRLNVPRIYHGIVKKECIEKVKEKCGVYFGGLTPDMFMSVALCFTVKKALVYSKPFTISGICPISGSADSATGRHTGELKDAPHFRGHNGYNWVEYVPYIYTVDTIWAETGIQALRKMGENKYEKHLNIRNFTLYLAAKFPQFEDRLINSDNYLSLKHKDVSVYKAKYCAYRIIKRLISLAKKGMQFDYARKFYDVKSIDEACEILTKIYRIK